MTKEHWKDEAKDLLHTTALRIEKALDAGKRRLRRRLPGYDSRYIQPHRGYANRNTAFVRGRVLRHRPSDGDIDDQSLWENLLDTYRRWESDEVPHAPVRLEIGDQTFEGESDEEGYLEFEVSLDQPLPENRLWHDARWVLQDEKSEGEPEASTVPIVSPPPTATFGVVSDVDDTVLHTSMTDLLSAAKLTFLGSARTRKPLDGVSALYQAFQRGPGDEPEHNPIFYVSSSAWNLYDLFEDFLELNEIPLGPILLRDLGIDENKFWKTDHTHKLDKALSIVDAFPDLPFVLIGDSGQQDAALYAELVHKRPGRVRAIYIRDIDPDTEDERESFVQEQADRAADADVPLVLVEHSVSIAEHAVEIGLLPAEAVETVREQSERDLAEKR